MSFLPFGRRRPAIDQLFDRHDRQAEREPAPLPRRGFLNALTSRFTWAKKDAPPAATKKVGRAPASAPSAVGAAPVSVPAASAPGTFAEKYQNDVLLQNLISLGREYSPADVNTFRRQARGGDPRKWYAFLDETKRLLLHSPLKRLFDGAASAEISYSVPVEAWDGPEDTSARAVFARTVRDYESDQWRPWQRVIKRTMASAEYYGIAACRVAVEVRGAAEGRERISLVAPVPARRFKVDTATGRWVVQLHPNSGDWLYVDDLVETGELIFWEVDPEQPLDQRGFGWVSMIPWVIAQYTLRWYALKVELTAMPQRAGAFDPTQAGHKELVEAALRNQAAASWIAYPVGSNIDLLSQPSMGGANDPHQTLWDTMKREIDLIVLGHAQASDVKVGAGSIQSTSSAQGIVDERINTLADEIAQGPFAQAVRSSVRRNFGDPVAAELTPRLTGALRKVEDPEVLSRVAVNLKQAGAGTRVAVDDLVRRCLGRVAKDDEQTLGPAAGETTPAGEAAPEEMQAAALRVLLGASKGTSDDPVDEIAERGRDKARTALRPLFAAIDRATSADDLETVERQLQQLAGVIGAAAMEGAVAGVEDERRALRGMR